MPIELSPFDPHTASDALWARYQAYRLARAAEDMPGEPIWTDAQFRAHLRSEFPLTRHQRWYASLDGEIVGNLIVSQRKDGTDPAGEYAHLADLNGGVRVAFRRRGVARALLAQARAAMCETGRTVATLSSVSDDGRAMLAHCGAVQKLAMVEQRLAVASIDTAGLQAWQTAVTPPLRWEVHAPRVPLERFKQMIPQLDALWAQVPIGTLDVPPPRQELSSLKAWYDDLDAHGGQHHLVWLFEGDQLVAASHGNWDARSPDRAFQNITAVDAAWRHRGLAHAVKARLLQQLLQGCPDARWVVTFNATSNAPILAVNQRFGFTLHRVQTSFQIGREALGDYLARR